MTSFQQKTNQPSFFRKDLKSIEYELENIFQIINPRHEFQEKLRSELISYPDWKLYLPKLLRQMIILLAGIASGLIILLTGIRAIFSVIGAIKIFQQQKTKTREEPRKSIRSIIATP